MEEEKLCDLAAVALDTTTEKGGLDTYLPAGNRNRVFWDHEAIFCPGQPQIATQFGLIHPPAITRCQLVHVFVNSLCHCRVQPAGARKTFQMLSTFENHASSKKLKHIELTKNIALHSGTKQIAKS